MVEFDFKKLAQTEMSRREFLWVCLLAVASLTGIGGVIKQLTSHAATSAANVEPETGTKTSAVSAVNDTTASGGQAIKFGPDAAALPQLGTYKPSASTTGWLRYGITLRPYNNEFGAYNSAGDLVISTPDVTIEGYDIPASIVVKAANVTIRKCRVRPSRSLPPGSDQGCVDCNGAPYGANVLVEDCELYPSQPSQFWDGILGHDYTSRRNHIKWTVDGHGVYNNTAGTNPTNGLTYKNGPTNVVIEGCYVHDLAGWITGANTVDGSTHNDACVQIQGGAGTIIRWNTVLGFLAAPPVGFLASMPYETWPGWGAVSAQTNKLTGLKYSNDNDFSYYKKSDGTNARSLQTPYLNVTTSCVQCTANVGYVTETQVYENWFDGGAVGVNLSHTSSAVGTADSVFGTCKNNRFGHNQGFPSGHGQGASNTTCFADYTSGTPKTTYADTSGNVFEDGNGLPSLRHN